MRTFNILGLLWTLVFLATAGYFVTPLGAWLRTEISKEIPFGGGEGHLAVMIGCLLLMGQALASGSTWAFLFLAHVFAAMALFFLSLVGLDLELYRALNRRGVPEFVFDGTVFLGFLAYFVWKLQQMIVSNIPNELDYVPTDLAAFPRLDGAALTTYTTELEVHGFTYVGDVALATDLQNGVEGFARLMVHPTHHVVAEVHQVFPPEAAHIPLPPLKCTLASVWVEGWALFTTDRKTDPIMYLIRLPRRIGRSRPELNLDDLLQAHLEMQKQVTFDLRSQPIAEDLVDTYLRHEQASNTERREVVAGRNCIVLAFELWLRDLLPVHEWWGEYASVATGTPL